MSHYHHRYMPQKPREKVVKTAPVVAKSTRKKSMGLAYLLWLLTGVIGGHRFYLGRYGSGFMLLGAFISLLIGLYSAGPYFLLFMYFPAPPFVFFVAFWGWLLLVIFDLYWTSFAIRKHNQSISTKLKKDDLSQVNYPSESR